MSEYNVRLICDGNGWTGSFGLAVETFVEDILSDGAPFDAVIVTENEDGTRRERKVVIHNLDHGEIFYSPPGEPSAVGVVRSIDVFELWA